ncbi:MAG: PEPxxWA-CTERM sorting domain-containing protein [Nitrosospira sp.]|nr:PEPxxWA-CTERM sorting domain-containing protein [Nitrosospira sp.]
MKRCASLETRGLILILGAVLGVSAGFGSPAFARAYAYDPVIVNPDGEVTYLGTLGGPNTYAYGINDSGQVVGVSSIGDDTSHAFITGPNGMGMIDLGTLGGVSSGATGINDSGQVVGYSYQGGVHAFITGPDGMGMTDLGTLGGNESLAYGINNSGQVVGRSDTADGPGHAFITGPNGMGMTDLGTLGGNESLAYGINNSGQVVGRSDTADGPWWHAFITGPNGMGMTDLGTLGGIFSEAYGINDSGQVVGVSSTKELDRHGNYSSAHAFITGPNSIGMTDLGTLGGDYSAAYGINDSGQVMGYSTTAAGSLHAFITGPNGLGMTDLNSIADMPNGFFLSSSAEIRTYGINNLGQVITTVVPEPASYALMLAGLGLVGLMARRKSAAGNIVARS